MVREAGIYLFQARMNLKIIELSFEALRNVDSCDFCQSCQVKTLGLGARQALVLPVDGYPQRGGQKDDDAQQREVQSPVLYGLYS